MYALGLFRVLISPFVANVYRSFSGPSANFCSVAMTSSAAPKCIRLSRIPGLNDRVSDLIYCRGTDQVNSHVVFFGGDVQDFPEEMKNKKHLKWNLENTAQLLGRRFPQSHVWVVRPSTLYLGTYSVFSNFLVTDSVGSPKEDGEGNIKYWGDYQGLKHLDWLLKNAMYRLSEMDSFNDKKEKSEQKITFEEESLPVTIVGFSKGCVVLNEFLHEILLANYDPEQTKFLERIKSLYWLDGGHSAGSNTWVTDSGVLKQLKGLNIKVHVHVTPYQVNDLMRDWIGKEERKFVASLKKLGVDVTEKLHFENEERSIENHFRVLEEF